MSELIPSELIERFKHKECVFFVGAGVSQAAGLSTGSIFKQQLIEKIQYPRPDVPLSKVAQAVEDAIDRTTLNQMIRENFAGDHSPAKSHESIAELANQHCTHLITTNFDNLLEKALDQLKHKYHKSKRDSDISLAGGKLHLIKLHGDADDNETIVITETDYRDSFREHPIIWNLISGLLVEKTLVFLGYSLEDPDFDQIYHQITRTLGDFQRLSYAVQVRSNEISEEDWNKFHVASWTRRKIRILTMDADDFLEQIKTGLVSAPINRETQSRAIKPLWNSNSSFTFGNLLEPENFTIEIDHPLKDCEVEVEVQILHDAGDASRWFGVRVRGITSYFHAGYLIYLRSSGYLDVTSVEERSLLKDEIWAVDPKVGVVRIKIAMIADQMRVWVNDQQMVEMQSNLVTWPGKIFLHTFGVIAIIQSLKVNEIC